MPKRVCLGLSSDHPTHRKRLFWEKSIPIKLISLKYKKNNDLANFVVFYNMTSFNMGLFFFLSNIDFLGLFEAFLFVHTTKNHSKNCHNRYFRIWNYGEIGSNYHTAKNLIFCSNHDPNKWSHSCKEAWYNVKKLFGKLIPYNFLK